MNSDFKDLLRLFAKTEVRYLVVGGYAAMHYSQPRFTRDLDLWLDPTQANAARALRAFAEGLHRIRAVGGDLLLDGAAC